MWDMLLNSKAGASAFASMFSDAPTMTTSGGPVDLRAFVGAGSNWTVATGGGRAEARTADPAVAAYGPSVVTAAASPVQAAGMSPVVLAVVGAVLLAVVMRKRKG